MAKLSREVCDTYESAQDIDIVPTLKLPYLQAVVKEALRMFPVVPQGLPRLSPGTVIGGIYVPQDVSSGMRPMRTMGLVRLRPSYTSLHGPSPTMNATSMSQIHSARSAGSSPYARTLNTQASRSHSGPVYVRGNGAQSRMLVENYR
jgi:hypothetical protein